jgi:hypothetical protein
MLTPVPLRRRESQQRRAPKRRPARNARRRGGTHATPGRRSSMRLAASCGPPRSARRSTGRNRARTDLRRRSACPAARRSRIGARCSKCTGDALKMARPKACDRRRHGQPTSRSTNMTVLFSSADQPPTWFRSRRRCGDMPCLALRAADRSVVRGIEPRGRRREAPEARSVEVQARPDEPNVVQASLEQSGAEGNRPEVHERSEVHAGPMSRMRMGATHPSIVELRGIEPRGRRCEAP